MAVHGRADLDLPEVRPEFFDHGNRILIGPVRGPEAGHGDGENVLPVHLQVIKGPDRHKKGQGGIEAPGNPDDGPGGMGMAEPLHEAHGLDIQNLGQTAVQGLFVRRNKGQGGNLPGEVRFRSFQMEGNDPVGLLLQSLIGIHPPPLFQKAGNIDVPEGGTGGKELRLGRQAAPVRNQVVAGEDQVLGGFRGPGAGIDISGVQAGCLVVHKKPPVGAFPDNLIRG